MAEPEGIWFCHRVEKGHLLLDFIFYAVAFSLDENGFGVMQEPVKDGGGEGGVVVEDLRPVFKARLDVIIVVPCS